MSEKSVFCETSSIFGLMVLYPTGSEISCLQYIKTRGRKIAIRFFAILISILWKFYLANKKKFVIIHLNIFFFKKGKRMFVFYCLFSFLCISLVLILHTCTCEVALTSLSLLTIILVILLWGPVYILLLHSGNSLCRKGRHDQT